MTAVQSANTAKKEHHDWCDFPDEILVEFMRCVRELPHSSVAQINGRRLQFWRLPATKWISWILGDVKMMLASRILVNTSTVGCTDHMAVHHYRAFYAMLRHRGWNSSGRAKVARSFLAIRARKTHFNRSYDKDLAKIISPESLGLFGVILR